MMHLINVYFSSKIRDSSRNRHLARRSPDVVLKKARSVNRYGFQTHMKISNCSLENIFDFFVVSIFQQIYRQRFRFFPEDRRNTTLSVLLDVSMALKRGIAVVSVQIYKHSLRYSLSKYSKCKLLW